MTADRRAAAAGLEQGPTCAAWLLLPLLLLALPTAAAARCLPLLWSQSCYPLHCRSGDATQLPVPGLKRSSGSTVLTLCLRTGASTGVRLASARICLVLILLPMPLLLPVAASAQAAARRQALAPCCRHLCHPLPRHAPHQRQRQAAVWRGQRLQPALPLPAMVAQQGPRAVAAV